MAFSAQQPDWQACVVDVKTAFLYAPVRGAQSEGEEQPVIVVKPPYLLVQLGVMMADDRWRVKRALYGLQTSPRDWAIYRDKEIRGIVLETPIRARLQQGVTDESLWLIKTEGGNLVGLMIVYVDDIALFGPRQVIEALVNELRVKWRLSEPSWAANGTPVTFCGMELTRAPYGWRVTQKRYLQELLQRYSVDGSATCPLTKWEEPAEEELDPESIRKAQGITGALLWAVTRSRPDMSFVVSLMAQYSTKTPGKVFEMGLQALRYASTTLDLGLEYRRVEGPSFGVEGQLPLSRSSNALEVYSDASHSPQGERSRQCVVVAWKGSVLLWEATKQSFTTLSTAESELVGMTHAAQVGECVAPVIEELVEDDIVISLLGDNAAALTAYEQPGGSWRSRHLRMRANAGRERIAAGVLHPSFVPGHLQVADIGTKPLPVGKLLGLLSLVNVRLPQEVEASLPTAKFFARKGRLERVSDPQLSPAMAMALAALVQIQAAEASVVNPGSCRTLVMVVLTKGTLAQPQDWSGVGFELAIVGGVAVVLLALLVWVLMRRIWRSLLPKEVEPLSPRDRQEQPSSSWEGANVCVEPISVAAEGVQHNQRTGTQLGSVVEHETCEFPLVGRMDPRSNWAPLHYLRGLLSLVGGLIFQCLGVDGVEVWLLRAVGRTFRYGVAFAYERAKGIQSKERTGRAVPVYDISQAACRAQN